MLKHQRNIGPSSTIRNRTAPAMMSWVCISDLLEAVPKHQAAATAHMDAFVSTLL